MAKIESGMLFGFLTTLSKESVDGRSHWWVECVCGTKKLIQPSQLRGAYRPTKSCGCKRIGLLRDAQTIHGASVKNGSAEYRTFITWQSMIWRCTNKARKDYSAYGGRGIKVCDRWLLSFANFLSDMGIKPKGYSLGRIDNDGNYCAENCRWETYGQQARNRRSNTVISFNGRTQPLIAWAEETGLSRDTITKRIDAGWSIEAALTLPIRARYSMARAA